MINISLHVHTADSLFFISLGVWSVALPGNLCQPWVSFSHPHAYDSGGFKPSHAITCHHMPSPYLGTLQCILQILELFFKEFLNWAQTCCCLESALFLANHQFRASRRELWISLPSDGRSKTGNSQWWTSGVGGSWGYPTVVAVFWSWVKHSLSAWWYTYPSEKYESQLGWLFPNIWKNEKCSKPPTSIYIYTSNYQYIWYIVYPHEYAMNIPWNQPL